VGREFKKNFLNADPATREHLFFYTLMSTEYRLAIQYGAFKSFYATYLPGVIPPTYHEFTQFRQKRQGR
jgi:hypothetical protein